jgi:hypothetical protein
MWKEEVQMKTSLVLSSIFFFTAVLADQGDPAQSISLNEIPVPEHEAMQTIPLVEFSQTVADATGHAVQKEPAPTGELAMMVRSPDLADEYASPKERVRIKEESVKEKIVTEVIKVEHKTTQLFEVRGEFLYLQAKEEGLEYAMGDSLPATGAVATDGVIGKVHRIKPDFHPGYRVALGFFFPKQKGELLAQWMHYQGTRNDTATQPIAAGSGLWPDYLDMSDTPMAAHAHARWNLNMNVFDLQVGTLFMEKKVLSLKPFAGFRAAWIKQKLDVSYKGVLFAATGTTTPVIRSKNHSDYAGYGICAGLDTNWKIWQGLSFFANGDISLLWSRFNNRQTAALADGTVRDNVKDKLYTTLPVFDLMAGFAYEYDWEFVGFSVHVGWEEQLWINQNMLDRYIDSSMKGVTQNSKGNLSLSGWNFRLSVTF